MPLLEEGSVLRGRYRIVRPVGEGGMGTVYEGIHERLGARVIVKTIAPTLENASEFRARFELEARAAARLTSPHVVKVFDVDVTDDGMMFMVMEYLEGETLSRLSARSPLSTEDACTFVSHVCVALEEAHRAGLVHRDIKPANIFIVGNGRDRFAKLLDFGIAKVLAPEGGSADDVKTQTGTVMGTPRYMAPEQLRGLAVDHRADLWSLGVVLYTLIARRAPFEERTGQPLLAAILLDPVPPIEQFAPEAPPPLARAIMLALERDPSHRHASARAFADALAPFARGSETFRTSAPEFREEAPPASATVPDLSFGAHDPTHTARMTSPERPPSTVLAAAVRLPQAESAPAATRSRRLQRLAAGVGAIAALIVAGVAARSVVSRPARAVPLVSVAAPLGDAAAGVTRPAEPPPPDPPVDSASTAPSVSTPSAAPSVSAERPHASPRGSARRTPVAPSAKPSAAAPAIPPIL